MKCTIQIRWDLLPAEEAARLLAELRAKPWEDEALFEALCARANGRYAAYLRSAPLKDRFPMRWLAELRPGVEKQHAPEGITMHSIDYYASVLPFFQSLAERYPSLTAEVRGDYEPDPVNLEKGRDDFGGFYELRLENGALNEEDIPFI
jgi:hypothetical protein